MLKFRSDPTTYASYVLYAFGRFFIDLLIKLPLESKFTETYTAQFTNKRFNVNLN